jgi:hypothetical protein
MRKIIEEILVPKPAARPRIYAYAIAEQPPLPAFGHPLLHSEWRRGLGRGGAPVSPLPARASQGEGVGRRTATMSKTIEEILLPKPAARPGIYAYAIADKAHTGLLEAGQTPRGVKQRFWNVLSGLAWIFDTNSRALPWAIVVCPFGANHHLRRTKGASCVSPGQRLGTPPAPTARPNTSPGQRPGYPNHKTHPALKGRPNPVVNPTHTVHRT